MVLVLHVILTCATQAVLLKLPCARFISFLGSVGGSAPPSSPTLGAARLVAAVPHQGW